MLVYTIKELCRTCYTCVRECPARAIRIVGGQAEVITEKCIACGNCTKVCSQGAKVFVNTTDLVRKVIARPGKKAAIVAPSFPAEFHDVPDYMKVVGMIRALGFDYVSEVSFGADLVAHRYRNLISEAGKKNYISSDCPAIVSFIRFYHPDLTPELVPVVSPMVAMSRVMRKKYGDDLSVVFIGPCVAKKAETAEVDAAITFIELREMLEQSGISQENAGSSEFDPPLGGRGAIFPVTRGLLQTAGVNDDAITGNIIAAEGRIGFQEAIKEYEQGMIGGQHLELLCCEGCIMGPGMSKGGKQYNRRAQVSSYAQKKMSELDMEEWRKNLELYDMLDLSVRYRPEDKRQLIAPDDDEEVRQVLASMGKLSDKDHLNCGACGYDTCFDHAIAIIKGLAEEEMCLPYTIEKLHKSVQDLALSNAKLTTMQNALKQSEKLAHMGQLSAGIAHELNNPLGVVIMYSNILLDEARAEDPLREDLQLIVEQAARCKKIVAGLLNFARKNQVNHQFIDIRKLTESSVAGVVFPDNVKAVIEDRTTSPDASIDSEQMTQVLTNLFRNAIDAMPDGGTLTVTLEDTPSDVIFIISDTGTGIREEDKPKIFEPFFTTKGIGRGTGLGLATTYGIVKMHKGQITVESNGDPAKGPTGTTFRIILPRRPE
ncbi:MAG: [Fe-Fe] hydrogenase large subunit C-terminal domain-containing protein [Bacteroidales bacterium]|jgi:iron only hydrogenase large subunit-like protein/nitrogen-specific signal transduction histidine kinase|nr:[Fe-Fe] hydrogenase large subunit C-terminal domain-containing protein [Bacteroidales bacterium]